MMQSRRSFLKQVPYNTMGMAGLMSAFFTAGESLMLPTVTYYDVVSEQVPPDFSLQIGFMTDLHIGCPGVTPDHVAHIVSRMNDLKPDIILSGGDWQINCHYDPRTVQYHPPSIAAMVKDLQAPLGVYSVLGNHDWDASRHGMIHSLNRSSHIRADENKRLTLHKDNTEFDLVLMPDYKTRHRKLNPEILDNPNQRPTIVLAHDPMHFRYVPDDTMLQLSGHTHGGQITMWGQPLHLPTKGLPSHWSYGHIIEENKEMMRPQRKQLIVSSGLGTSTIPLKNTPYEIVHVHLKGAQPSYPPKPSLTP